MLKALQMSAGLAVLVGFLYLGSLLNVFLNLPIPDPLSGLILLFVTLLFFRNVPKSLQHIAQFLLQHISLFFIPVTIYAIVLKEKFAEHLVLLSVVIVVSTFFSMLLTAAVSKRTLKTEQAK